MRLNLAKIKNQRAPSESKPLKAASAFYKNFSNGFKEIINSNQIN